jgi:hypothetical protein
MVGVIVPSVGDSPTFASRDAVHGIGTPGEATRTTLLPIAAPPFVSGTPPPPSGVASTLPRDDTPFTVALFGWRKDSSIGESVLVAWGQRRVDHRIDLSAQGEITRELARRITGSAPPFSARARHHQNDSATILAAELRHGIGSRKKTNLFNAISGEIPQLVDSSIGLTVEEDDGMDVFVQQH